jgi:hypothetical protein
VVTANGTTGLSPALAQAAGQPGLGAHTVGHAELFLAIIALAALSWLVYRVSLWLHPFASCRRCGGSGQIRGFLPWSRAFCYKCNGRGLVPRFGTKVGDLRGRYPR